jgi:N-hydroxyarylamine O-acetyltransferase
MTPSDLDAYCARIGFAGPRAPTLETLAALHWLHPQAIPFENLDPLRGLPVELSEDALVEKLVRRGRGGYCFEQNGLLAAALRTLGFDVTTLAARVLHNRPPTPPGTRSHELLRVRLPEGDFLADVGFGGLTLTAPLREGAEAEQQTPFGRYRLVPSGPGRELQIATPEGWSPVYLVLPDEQVEADREAMNWFTSTHPKSVFTNNLLAARHAGDRRYGLFNDGLSIHHADGTIERRRLGSTAAIAEALRTTFAVVLPPHSEEALARIPLGGRGAEAGR